MQKFQLIQTINTGTQITNETIRCFLEEEDGTVSVRSRFAGDEGVKPLDDFINQICKEIDTKEIRKEEHKENQK